MNWQAANASPRCELAIDQDDLVARLEVAVAVDHRVIEDLPLRARLLDDLPDGVLGHARVVLERHRHLAHLSDEARAAPVLGFPEISMTSVLRSKSSVCTEIFMSAAGHGRKKATSSPGLSGALAAAMSWLTATRTAFMSPSISCHAPPRHEMQPQARDGARRIGISTTSAPRRAARAGWRRTALSLSPVQLRIGQEAHRIALRIACAAGLSTRPSAQAVEVRTAES